MEPAFIIKHYAGKVKYGVKVSPFCSYTNTFWGFRIYISQLLKQYLSPDSVACSTTFPDNSMIWLVNRNITKLDFNRNINQWDFGIVFRLVDHLLCSGTGTSILRMLHFQYQQRCWSSNTWQNPSYSLPKMQSSFYHWLYIVDSCLRCDLYNTECKEAVMSLSHDYIFIVYNE